MANRRSTKDTEQLIDPLTLAPVVDEPAEPTFAVVEANEEEVPALAGNARPVPEAKLSPEQKRIRELENQLAIERGRKDPEVEFEAPAPGNDENILIHFLEDGFTAVGHVWYRGQELEFTPNSEAYRDTVDRLGRSWLDYRNDEFGQVDRYGKVMFRKGPWPGKPLTAAANVPYEKVRAADGQVISAPTAQELEAAARTEARRGRAVPRLPRH